MNFNLFIFIFWVLCLVSIGHKCSTNIYQINACVKTLIIYNKALICVWVCSIFATKIKVKIASKDEFYLSYKETEYERILIIFSKCDWRAGSGNNV